MGYRYRNDFNEMSNGLTQNSTELDVSKGIKPFLIWYFLSYFYNYPEISLDDLIKQYKDNIYSIELQKSLLSITESQFQELKKESVKIILPLILRWLQDEGKHFQ